jgi:hypothetical protein
VVASGEVYDDHAAARPVVDVALNAPGLAVLLAVEDEPSELEA